MDKLMVSETGEVTISNDGATIMKLLDVVHPAAKILVDIARSQDAEASAYSTICHTAPQHDDAFILYLGACCWKSLLKRARANAEGKNYT